MAEREEGTMLIKPFDSENPDKPTSSDDSLTGASANLGLIIIILIVILALAAGGFAFYKKQQKDKQRVVVADEEEPMEQP